MLPLVAIFIRNSFKGRNLLAPAESESINNLISFTNRAYNFRKCAH